MKFYWIKSFVNNRCLFNLILCIWRIVKFEVSTFFRTSMLKVFFRLIFTILLLYIKCWILILVIKNGWLRNTFQRFILLILNRSKIVHFFHLLLFNWSFLFLKFVEHLIIPLIKTAWTTEGNTWLTFLFD